MHRALTLAIVLLNGCKHEADKPPVDEVVVPDLPLEFCGADAYTLLDPQGQALDHEYLPQWDLTAASLQGLITLADIGDVPIVYGVQMWRYRYTTQDRGSAIEATGLIAVPAHLEASPDEPWPVALLLHGFMGATDACAPSADSLIGPALPAALASQGYAVIAPDYIGMNGMGEPSTAPHAPLVGEQVAIGSWDGWRAGRDLLGDELAPTGGVRDDVVLYGASQGGHAAFFTELYGPYYAPEADVVAIVASTPATDLGAIVQDAVSQYSDRTGLSALAMVGMRRWYGIPADLTGTLTNSDPYYIADTVEELLSMDMVECAIEVEFEASTVEEIFADPFLSAAQSWDESAMVPWACFFNRSSVATSGVPRLRETPILTVYGEEDTLVRPDLMYDDFDGLCADGWQLDFLECADAPHGEATLWSLGEQIDWLRDRLDGVPQEEFCVRKQPTCCSGSPTDICG